MGALVLEVGVEELPPWVVPQIEKGLESHFNRAVEAHKVICEKPVFFATPRRFGVHSEKFEVSEEGKYRRIRGPKVEIFYEGDSLSRAGEGFLKKWGLKEKDVEIKDGYVWAVVRTDTDEKKVLEDVLKGLEKMSFPKMMRWSGGEGKPFVRPVRWFLCLLDGEVVPLSFFGVSAGRVTRGVRIHGVSEREIVDRDDYLKFLSREKIVSRFEDRVKAIERELEERGVSLQRYRTLVEEVAGSVESFTLYEGQFDGRFGTLPREIIETVLEKKGKVFPSNIEASSVFFIVSSVPKNDLTAIPAGYSKLANSRLSDVEFYMRKDRGSSFEDMNRALGKFAFLRGAGTLLDRSERLERVCKVLGSELFPESELRKLLELSRVAKSDLSTALVVEYTDLAGVVGRLYGKERGLDEDVCDGILDHYYPEKGSLSPHSWVRFFAVVDRIEYLVATAALGLKHTSTKDPFGIRRTAGALLTVLYEAEDDFDVYDIAEASYAEFSAQFRRGCWRDTWAAVEEVLNARALSLMKEKGIHSSLWEATIPLSHRPGRAFSFVKVLSPRMRQGDEKLKEILRVAERLSNILGEEDPGIPPNPEILSEPAEKSLFGAVESFPWDAPKTHDWEKYLNGLYELVPLVDRFFDDVLVNVDDEVVRRNRKRLVWRALQPFTCVVKLQKVSFRHVK